MENNYKQPVFNGDGNYSLPNATAALVLGILSILSCWCYGLGVILGIIGWVIAAKDKRRYRAEPGIYSRGSYNNLQAGLICSIIGFALSALFLIFLLVVLAAVGWENIRDPNAMRDYFEGR